MKGSFLSYASLLTLSLALIAGTGAHAESRSADQDQDEASRQVWEQLKPGLRKKIGRPPGRTYSWERPTRKGIKRFDLNYPFNGSKEPKGSVLLVIHESTLAASEECRCYVLQHKDTAFMALSPSAVDSDTKDYIGQLNKYEIFKEDGTVAQVIRTKFLGSISVLAGSGTAVLTRASDRDPGVLVYEGGKPIFELNGEFGFRFSEHGRYLLFYSIEDDVALFDLRLKKSVIRKKYSGYPAARAGLGFFPMDDGTIVFRGDQAGQGERVFP